MDHNKYEVDEISAMLLCNILRDSMITGSSRKKDKMISLRVWNLILNILRCFPNPTQMVLYC